MTNEVKYARSSLIYLVRQSVAWAACLVSIYPEEESIESSFCLLCSIIAKIYCSHAEIKLVYQLNPHLKEQHYTFELFLFFSSELASGDLSFYQNLWTTVKLHTPKVSILNLMLQRSRPALGPIDPDF